MFEAGGFKRTSLAEQARNALKEEIISGRVKPNERIDLKHYSEQWAISPTPLREALKDLESAGLVEISPRRGVFVAELDRNALREIFQLRIALESMATQLATQNIPANVARQTLGQYVSAQESSGRTRTKQLKEIDDLIHDVALKYCQNGRLTKMMESVHDLVEWSKSSIIRYVPNPFEETLPEHIKICRAMVAKDAEKAAGAMRDHLERTVARIDEFLDA